MKITHYGKPVSTLKHKISKIVRFLTATVFSLGIIIAIFLLGAVTFSTSTTEANNIVTIAPLSSPVLDRIADCESGNGKKGSASQFRNGQIILHANRNRTTDIGKFQINMQIWGKQATKLGFDLATEKGNTEMAQWIYLNRGTAAWYLSRKCWL